MRSRISLLMLPAMLLASASCKQEQARVEPPPPKVSVAHPEVRNLVESDSYNGWIDATATVEVRARVRGHIQKVSFKDGDIVKKDQMLFELDPRPFEADVGRAEDQLKVYQAQVVAARKEEARLKDLLSKGGSSQSQVDKAEADSLSLEAQAEAAKQEIARVGLNLEYSKITAAIGGRISRALLTEGNLVNAGGSDPLMTTIVAIDPVYVYFSVDERSLQRYMRQRAADRAAAGNAESGPRSGALKESQLAFQFGLETDQGYPHDGVLDFIDNQVDKTTGTVLVRGAVANPTGMYVPGSRVKVRVPVSAEKSALLVPDTAVLSDQDKRYLLVVDNKNTVQRCDISPGRLLDDGMRVVISGKGKEALAAGSWVIVVGLQSARINYPVQPVVPAGTQPASTMTASR